MDTTKLLKINEMHNFFLHKNILIFRRFFNSANRLHNIKNKKIMAIEIKTIPVLHGEAAARFVEAADEALEKRGSIDFSKQVAKARAILKRSKLYI